MNKETREKLLKSFGTQRKIAAFVGTTPATVSYWLTGQHHIPVKYAKRLAIETGISFFDLRTDIPRG
jgi:DNA-binding transcriptional regulator YdaS (Cro superfamily)